MKQSNPFTNVVAFLLVFGLLGSMVYYFLLYPSQRTSQQSSESVIEQFLSRR